MPGKCDHAAAVRLVPVRNRTAGLGLKGAGVVDRVHREFANAPAARPSPWAAARTIDAANRPHDTSGTSANARSKTLPVGTRGPPLHCHCRSPAWPGAVSDLGGGPIAFFNPQPRRPT